MKITLAYMKNPNSADSPEMISSYDDITAEAWGGAPDFHTKAVKRALADGQIVREAVITVPDSAIAALFATSTLAVMGFEPVDPNED